MSRNEAYADHDETDCEPACFAMIASHFGMKKNIASIRTIAGIDKQGTKALRHNNLTDC